MSNEIDSNMLLTSLLYCYGGFIQNEENRIVIGQGANRKGAIQALQVMRDLYRNGMSDEVFAWTAASNNQAFLAGRLSVALNAISIVRSAGGLGKPGAVGRHMARLDPARAPPSASGTST
jgi:multiple sugar transport system substrate-binding protein